MQLRIRKSIWKLAINWSSNKYHILMASLNLQAKISHLIKFRKGFRVSQVSRSIRNPLPLVTPVIWTGNFLLSLHHGTFHWTLDFSHFLRRLLSFFVADDLVVSRASIEWFRETKMFIDVQTLSPRYKNTYIEWCESTDNRAAEPIPWISRQHTFQPWLVFFFNMPKRKCDLT